MITLPEKNRAEIIAHAERDYPNECGGLLLGHFDAVSGKQVTETMPMENTAAAETQHDRILIDPRDVMKAEQYAREQGVDVIGYYHSHPDDEAVPSQFDLDHALPAWSYIIVSVRDRKAVDLRSWEMENDRSKFNTEEMKQGE